MVGFRPDRMTEKERFEALLKRQPLDRVPLSLLDNAFSSLNVGYTKCTVYDDGKKGFKARSRTYEMYGAWRFMSPETGAFGAREFGGEINPPTSPYASAPALAKPAVESEEDVWKLELPDVRTAGMIPVMMDFAKEMQKNGWPIGMSPMGPLDVVGYMTEVERMCRWMVRKPELVHRLCRLATDFTIELTRYWVDTFGEPERIIPHYSVPTEANQIVSPKQFEEFALPYIKEYYQSIFDMGVKHTFTHICGEQNLNLPYWAQVKMGDPAILSFGHEVDLETASKYFPNDVIFGNVEPAVIQSGEPEEVYELCRICIEKGKKHAAGFVLAPGCEMPLNAPPYNVWTMRKAVNDFGWYA